MIRRLRRRHFRIALILAVVVPLLIVAAVRARHPVPRSVFPAPLALP
jgi:hypothetical protein